MEQQSPNERRLEDWMRTYGTAILRTCFVILSDTREAEDAMQDTFLRAWRAMDTFEQRQHPLELIRHSSHLLSAKV